jgi:hypothetical protein
MKDTVDRIATSELAATTLQIWNAVNTHFYFAHQFGPETSLIGVSLCEFYLYHSTRQQSSQIYLICLLLTSYLELSVL